MHIRVFSYKDIHCCVAPSGVRSPMWGGCGRDQLRFPEQVWGTDALKHSKGDTELNKKILASPSKKHLWGYRKQTKLEKRKDAMGAKAECLLCVHILWGNIHGTSVCTTRAHHFRTHASFSNRDRVPLPKDVFPHLFGIWNKTLETQA